MSMMSTFGSFTMARLGIYAAQKGLSVTGNNIANINTVGYTRQTLDQISLRTNSSLQRGEQGVLVTAAFTKDTALRGLITAGF